VVSGPALQSHVGQRGHHVCARFRTWHRDCLFTGVTHSQGHRAARRRYLAALTEKLPEEIRAIRAIRGKIRLPPPGRGRKLLHWSRKTLTLIAYGVELLRGRRISRGQAPGNMDWI
jgi:hypothetical protein